MKSSFSKGSLSFKTIAALIFISFSIFSNAQIIDMSSIEGLQNQIGGQSGDDINDDNEEDDDIRNKKVLINPDMNG